MTRTKVYALSGPDKRDRIISHVPTRARSHRLGTRMGRGLGKLRTDSPGWIGLTKSLRGQAYNSDAGRAGPGWTASSVV